jgi:alpha-ketoglutarate-dependent taurine dioxygenase
MGDAQSYRGLYVPDRAGTLGPPVQAQASFPVDTPMSETPELMLASTEAAAVAQLSAETRSAESLEADLLGRGEMRSRLKAILSSALRRRAADLWSSHDHLVLRGIPPSEDGRTALLVAGFFFRSLRPYRETRIVKCFRMSPWTTALSHTLADGSFHTDINTAAQPPAATLMQCLTPDPDAPKHGQLRVARFVDVLEAVRRSGTESAWRLLTDQRVVMVNDASAGHWAGKVLDGDTVRFHPETLRAGRRRLGENPEDLEASLRNIHDAALSVSQPIDLQNGDLLLVSNRRALHQRGPCTVRFRSFPRDFESRSVAVLHAMDDLV